MLNKDTIIYFCMNSNLKCEFYYHSGFSSALLAKIHYKNLCNKNKGKSYYLRKVKLSELLEHYYYLGGEL